MNEEAHPEAAAILRDAGWKPHDPWGVYTRGTLVMGFSPDGQHFDVKNWGADVHGPDYPDDPVEAAQWLVRLRANPLQTEATLEPFVLAQEQEAVETPQHESDGETASLEGADVALGGDDRPDDRDDGRASLPGIHGPLVGEWEEAAEGSGGASDDLLEPEASGDVGADPIDADFTIEDLGGPDEPEQLEAPDVLLAEDSDYFIPRETASPQDQARFYGLSDFYAKIKVAMGRVVEISMERQEAIWADANASEDEFAALHNAVLRDTKDGVFTGPAAIYERFVSLQTHANAANAVMATERRKISALRAMTRDDELDAFSVEADWP